MAHIERRLTQITSSILSFVARLAGFAIFASILDLHTSGLALVAMLAVLASVLVGEDGDLDRQ